MDVCMDRFMDSQQNQRERERERQRERERERKDSVYNLSSTEGTLEKCYLETDL